LKSQVNYENAELDGEYLKTELWKDFEDREEQMRILRRDLAPGSNNYDDDYNQYNVVFNSRSFSGMDNNPRMKELFVELEGWVENILGADRIEKKQMKLYKGTTKKWQILDDAVFDRDQIEKL
jgi:hypothetical protein